MNQTTVKTELGTFATKKGKEEIKKKLEEMKKEKASKAVLTSLFLLCSFFSFAQPIVGSLEISDDKVILVQNQVSEAKSFDLTYWKGIKLVTNNIPSKTTCRVMFENQIYTVIYGSGKYTAKGPKGEILLESTTIESIRAVITVEEYKRKTGQKPPIY